MFRSENFFEAKKRLFAMSILKVSDVNFSYGGLLVLENLSFAVNPGEKVALIGPNGAGKSTLLNILSGLLYPKSGRVYLSDKDISQLPPHRRVSLGIGRSFQKSALFSGLNVLNNVLIALKGVERSRYQMTKPLDSSRSCVAQAEELLKKVKLWPKRGLQVEILSHGEKRQLEIVLSLACRPKVLLLDEPSAGLTSGESVEVVELIRGLMEDTAVLFAAHDLDLVYELSDRVLVLYYGHILAQGTPEEIQNDPKVQEIYLGTEAKVARTD